MPPTITIQKQKTSYECPRFKVEETVYTQDGSTRKTFMVRPSGDLLVIIPRLNDKIVFMESYSPPLPEKQWILPVGFVSPGVAIAETAQTILVENTGTVAQRFIYLGKFYPSKYMNTIAHVMIGENLSRYTGAAEDVKDKVAFFDEKKIGSLLMERTLGDGLTLASYVYYVTSEHYWTEVHNGARNSNRPGQANK